MSEQVVALEKARVYRPIRTGKDMTYKEFEGAVRQVMNYYMGYRRNQSGMETALEKLSFLERYLERIGASDYRGMMKANESSDLVKMCKLAARVSMERKESGRAYFKRSDYPELDPSLNKPLVIWKEEGLQKLSWGA